MSDDSSRRSSEACPVCGAHTLHLLFFPNVDVTGVQPYNELIGMGDPRRGDQPGIGCEECGSEWSDLASFRAGDEPARRS